MKILYVIHQFYPEYFGGTERFLFNVASMMQRAGHSVRVVTYSHQLPKPTLSEFTTNEYVYHSIPVMAVRHSTELPSLHLQVHNEQVHRFAIEYLQEHGDVDIVHIAHPMRLGSFAHATIELEKPYILTLTDSWTICAKGTLRNSSGNLCDGPRGGSECDVSCPSLEEAFVRPRLQLAKELLFGANAVVSPTHFLASRIVAEHPSLRIYVFPHGMDFKSLSPNERCYSGGDPIVFGYSGSLIEMKGAHLLIKAFNALNSHNAELRLYGSSYHEVDYFNDLKREASRNSSIHFCGSYDHDTSGKVLSDLDVLVVPSVVHESFSMATHEALACHVPVIAARVGGLPDFVLDGQTGFTFEPMNWESLAEKMQWVIDNPTILNDMKAQIAEKPRSMIEEEAFLYEKLYNGILQH